MSSPLDSEFWPRNFDEWRPIPRLCLGMYGFMLWETTQWFMALPEPNQPQSMFVSVIVGAAPFFFNFYLKTGPQTREQEPMSTKPANIETNKG